MACHWTALPTIKMITLLRKGFDDTPGQKSGLSKVTSCLTLTGCHVGHGYRTHLSICTIVFILPRRLHQGVSQNVLTITKASLKMGS